MNFFIPRRTQNYNISSRIICFLFILVTSALGTEYTVKDAAQIKEAAQLSQPGDKIVLQDGIWADQNILFRAQGTQDRPITLCAQTPGKVILTGNSTLQILGRHLVVEGLCFKGSSTGPQTDTIAFGTSQQEAASDCRLTRCAVIDYSPADKGVSTQYVKIYGQRNRVDHCFFTGKANAAVTLMVSFAPGSSPNHHLIDHNHFGPRPPLGINGGETIQIGWSGAQFVNSRTTVEYNYFEECNGEHEVITNKSCENIYRYNTFVRCQGVLSLRVGNRCTVESNFFLGQNVPLSGGVHVFGEDHRIINNYFSELAGTRFSAALSLMNGSAMVSVGQNRYEDAHDHPDGVPLHPPVKRVLVAFNTFVECKSFVDICAVYEGFRKQSTIVPSDCVLANNIFSGANAAAAIKYSNNSVNTVWLGNIMTGNTIDQPQRDGIAMADLRLVASSNGLWRPAADCPAIGAALGLYEFVRDDIEGHLRPATKRDVGCDQHSTAPPQRQPLTPMDVGPGW